MTTKIPNSYLKADPVTLVRDQRHAARLFTDDHLRLAPKSKFLFHVAFNINPAALRTIALTQRHRNEINMLVKSVDLPNFQITVDTANQYNRKKNIQVTHKFQGITIKFHDDNMGLINQLWQNYYSYYYGDSAAAQDDAAYKKTATKNGNHIRYNYGLDTGFNTPFFNYITIYQMARGEYVSYKLHNPVITSWNHNNVDYSQGGYHDNSMGLSYEAVSYGSGLVKPGEPEGFALEHYDLEPSPLLADPSAADVATASPSFSGQSALESNGPNFLNNVIRTVNSYSNTKQPGATVASSASTITSSASSQSVGGLAGIQFPSAALDNKLTPAKAVSLKK